GGWINNLAASYRELARYQDVLDAEQKSLKLMEKIVGPDRDPTITCLNNLASVYLEMAKYDDALPLFQRALDTAIKSANPTNSTTAVCLSNLGGLYTDEGKYDLAKDYLERGLQTQEKVMAGGARVLGTGSAGMIDLAMYIVDSDDEYLVRF